MSDTYFDAVILGDGPAGLGTALELLNRGHTVLMIGQHLPPDVRDCPWTSAWPFAAGHLQPFRAGEGGQDWWLRTRAWAKEQVAEGNPAVIEIVVRSVHNHTAGYRPEWAAGLESDEMDPSTIPEGWSNGFTWTSWAIQPSKVHAQLLALFYDAGGERLEQTIRTVGDVKLLTRRFRPHVVVDALGISSKFVFGDPEMQMRVGHLLVGPNFHQDSQAVMAEDDLMYVLVGPEHFFIGGTYDIDVVDEATMEFDGWLRPEIHERLISALTLLRPDLAEREDFIDQLMHQVGVRPYRARPRLETERLRGLPPVVHATGLGGSGWSFWKGFAASVADEAAAHVRGLQLPPPEPLKPFQGTSPAELGTDNENDEDTG